MLQDGGPCVPRGLRDGAAGAERLRQKHAAKTALGCRPRFRAVLYDGAPLSSMPPEQGRGARRMAQSRNVPSIEARRMVLHGRFPYLSFPRRYRKSDYDGRAAPRWKKADALELADRPMQG